MKSKTSKITVLIADDHKMVRLGLAAIFETEPDIQVVGLAANGEEAVAQAADLHPNVVIMDLMMPVMDGVAATAEIHRRLPDVKVLILTTFDTSDGIAYALESGASGALAKNADNDELTAAIRKIARGERAVSPEIQRQLEIDPPIPVLTARQKEILNYMIRGLTNTDIAKQLGIRPDGVKEHINAILLKPGAANRTEAVAIALRKHLLKI